MGTQLAITDLVTLVEGWDEIVPGVRSVFLADIFDVLDGRAATIAARKPRRLGSLIAVIEHWQEWASSRHDQVLADELARVGHELRELKTHTPVSPIPQRDEPALTAADVSQALKQAEEPSPPRYMGVGPGRYRYPDERPASPPPPAPVDTSPPSKTMGVIRGRGRWS